MQNLKNKSLTILVAAILVISIGASVALIPNASAHTPPQQITLFPNINVGPDPAGLGQSVTIAFWLNEPPLTASGPYGDRFGPFTINVIKPDGTNDTLGPFISDDTGGTSAHYTPATIGTYKFQMVFPGMTMTGYANNPIGAVPTSSLTNTAYLNDTILPAISPVATLTVQQNPVPQIPAAPLPTSYWQTPINAMNVQNWYSIGGPYLDLYLSYGPGKGGGNYNTTTNFNPYSTAPTTAHVMWTRPVAFGGTIGGDAGGSTTYGNYYSTSQYERKYSPIVINGFLYYTQFPGSSTSPLSNICVDLYTGKTVWVNDGSNYNGGTPSQNMMTSTGVVTPFVCGQVLDYVSPNQYGGLAYLWTSGTPVWITPSVMNVTGTTLNMYDAMTGKYILSVVNGTGFSYGLTVDSSGALVSYYTNTTVGTQTIYGAIQPVTGPQPVKVSNTAGNTLLEAWNSSQCIMVGAGWSTGSASGWFWRPPQGALIPFSYGIQSAWQLPGTVPVNGYTLTNATYPNTWTIIGVNSGSAVLYSAANNGLTNYFQYGFMVFTGYDVNNPVNATVGKQLFVQNVSFTPFTAINLDNYGNVGQGSFTTICKETGVVTAFSVTTGQQLWQTTLTGTNGGPINPYDTVGGIKGNIYGNSFLVFGFGGDVWSMDLSTGKVNWYTNTTQITGEAGTNTPYDVWPIWVQTGIGGGGGLMFLEEGHEYSPPLFIGAQIVALNVTTGALVWQAPSFAVDGNPELAYGIMTALNAYDNQVYAYGQGPSQTTVSAPQVGITTNSPVTITGTVTDISAGSKQAAVAANYPNGLPCVSDASQSQFMATVYQQQPDAHNETGVPVTISVIDSNNNYRIIGNTITDGTGTYGFNWTPDIAGNYTVIATFAGSGAYWGSTAQTHVYAMAASATTNPTSTTSTGTETTNTYVLVGVVAIIIAIAIVGAVLAMMLRKKA